MLVYHKNAVTYHVTKWLMESGLVSVTSEIANAFARVRPKDSFPDEDTCYALREELAQRLKSLCEDEIDNCMSNRYLLYDGWIGTVDDSFESLWIPLLAFGFAEVDFKVVAEILLRENGKWAPSKVLPDVK